MDLKVLGVIPARFGSSRFPGKPLVDIAGKSMIRRVYEQALQSSSISRLIVATDDSRIESHVKDFGGEVRMTSKHHTSGTERIGEVIERLKAEGDCNFRVVVNIQGDEPLLNPGQIDLAVESFSQPQVEISSLMKQISIPEELFNPNVVKVVVDCQSDALYFSRSTIPYLRGHQPEEWLEHQTFYKHIGLYAYRMDVLSRILKLAPGQLEKSESLEQLRWLENGFKIRLVPTNIETISVDSPEDLLKLTNKV
ncbi:MAG: 3-deoxy-manno-octulosonate cytidylyltransferase [Bacteroidetes bacterium]|nr:3-deoxy-manno-octulosonate cytidylyltransferase [Bacteroidota bacterium]